jgi:hypothetical protein
MALDQGVRGEMTLGTCLANQPRPQPEGERRAVRIVRPSGRKSRLATKIANFSKVNPSDMKKHRESVFIRMLREGEEPPAENSPEEMTGGLKLIVTTAGARFIF